MKALNLAVVCPVRDLPQNASLVRNAVWAQVSGLLQPNLGRLYSSFYPASHAWGINLNTPFGVLLGRDDPLRFMHILAAAKMAQDAAIDFHVKALLSGVAPDEMCASGDTIICPVHLDGTDKALEAHSIWHLGMANGALLPDCGIYYAGQKRAIAGPELANDISARLADYAVCVVALEIEEGAA